MPTPSFFEARAIHLWPYRWAFGAGSVSLFAPLFGFVYVYAILDLESPLSARAFFALFAVLSSASLWLLGLLLIAVWFHPIHGRNRVGIPRLLPRGAQVIVRWYASFVLGVLFLTPLVLLASLLHR